MLIFLLNNKIIGMKHSISLANSDSIRKHQANNSSSKNAYAFSKTPRFPQPNPECKLAFYQQKPSELSNRKASFGYGTKSDFTKTSALSPSPNNYEIKSCFDLKKEKGSTFGTARESLPDNSYTVPQLQRVPGPGQYQSNKKTLTPLKYTMRGRSKDYIQEKLTYKQNPGPGAYDSLEMDPKNGRFYVSKFSDCKYGLIDKNRPRFESEKKIEPSPLSYLEKDGISPNGKYVLSTRQGTGIRSFPSSKRLTFIDESKQSSKKLPGPGVYDKPSDFGVYGTYSDGFNVSKAQKQ